MSTVRSQFAFLLIGLLLISTGLVLAGAGLAALAGPGASTYPFTSEAAHGDLVVARSPAKKDEVRRLAAATAN